MTALWGPMGWMTLHSISMLYPESPSSADRAIVKRYIELFRDTLTCIHCHNHFKTLYDNYTRTHPEWASSRFDLFLFVARAHNAVNLRLNKPRPSSVQECITTFQSNTVVTSALTYRTKYNEYLLRTWAREMSGESIMKVGLVRELKRITEEYWNTKQDMSVRTFNMSANVFETESDASSRPSTISQITSQQVNIGFKGGRLQLRR